MANIGINLLEIDGRATPSIQGAATSVAGFIIGARRGVPGKVRLVTNYTEFVELFGSYHATYNGAYAVKGFFDNGGAVAYVSRAYLGAPAVSEATATDGESGDGPLTVFAGYRGEVDPGAWGDGLTVDVVYHAGTVQEPTPTFDLTVNLGGKQVEFWGGLPATVACVDKVNNEFTGSRYIKIAFNAAETFNTEPETLTLDGGDDEGTVGDEDEITTFDGSCIASLPLFDTIDVQLLTCPESAAAAVANAGFSYAGLRGDCIYVTHTLDVDRDAAETFGAGLRSANVYGAVYWPWIRVHDPLGTSRWIPPTGHVLGVIARTERERGVWKAPAGVATRVAGALDVRHHISDAKHTILVKQGGVNAVRFIAGQGIVIDSARTLSSNVLWQFINVRLLFNFVKSSLKNGLRWVVYEPNDDVLWNKVKYNAVTPFLMNLWRRGAFGPGSPDEVFSIKCDLENNPPANIQQGILNVEVYFYPSRPAETFIITVGQQEGGPTASES